MERKINFAVGEFYHIYNRGVEKRDIFLDDRDRERLLRSLYLANSSKPFVFRDMVNMPYADIKRGELRTAIGAYCFMPNHFHLLVRETVENGISTFMEKLGTGHSTYFNIRHTRVGPLFQGRFKAAHADRDEYLKYLFSYIHLNPVKLLDPLWKQNGIADRNVAKRFLEKYRYSSYIDYSGVARDEKAILSPEEFPDYFSDPRDFDSHVDDWLSFNEGDEIENENKNEGEEKK